MISVPSTERHTSRPERLRFRADIEGLRAIAVVAVILFHADVPGWDGGYVGVDVFFVVSGFLITGILVHERATRQRIDLGRFYARRARRLLPASTLVLVATLAGVALVGGALVREQAGITARWVAAFAANIRFAQTEVGYFAEGETPSPFLHFWSLAVEEQFYVLWPALIVLVTWRATSLRRIRRALLVVLGTIAVASFTASVVVTDRSASDAFYLLPTRAWELAVGAIVAIAGLEMSRRTAAVLSVSGLAGIAISIATFGADTSFPGPAAALPVLATAVLIVGGSNIGPDRPAGIQRVLGSGPMRRIGAYSYSLYLWHWPVLILAGLVSARISRSWPLSLGAVLIVAVPAAVLSFHVVEDPVRRNSRIGSGRSLAMGGGLIAFSLLVASLSTIGLRFDSGRPAPVAASAEGGGYTATDFVPSDLRPDLREASTDLSALYSVGGCDWARETTAADPCTFGDPDGDTRVVLLGDSHAGQWFDPLDAISLQRGWRLETLVTPSCSAMGYRQGRSECSDWQENAIELLESDPPDAVVLVDSGFRIFGSDRSEWERGVRSTVERLTRVTDVVLFGETSRPPGPATDCLADHVDDVRPCEPDASDENRLAEIHAEGQLAADLGAHYVDLTPLLCWDGRCPPIVGDVLVYRDASHITRTFAELRTEPLSDALLTVDTLRDRTDE